MPDYQLLILNSNGEPHSFDAFGAISDRLAWEYVRVAFPAATMMELWSGARQLDAPAKPLAGQAPT